MIFQKPGGFGGGAQAMRQPIGADPVGSPYTANACMLVETGPFAANISQKMLD